MITVSLHCLYPKDGTLRDITMDVVTSDGITIGTLKIEGELVRRFGGRAASVAAFDLACSRLGAKESWEWEHGVD